MNALLRQILLSVGITLLMLIPPVLYMKADWWMFFCYCLTAFLAFLQLGSFSSIEVQDFVKDGDSIDGCKQRTRSYVITLIAICCLQILMCAYPFIFMIDLYQCRYEHPDWHWNWMNNIHWYPYEGGVIVFLAVICTIGAEIMSIVDLFSKWSRDIASYITRKIEEAEEENRKEREKRRKIETFIAKHGHPDKTIYVVPEEFTQAIHVYEADRKVIINGKKYAWDDIIKCEYEDYSFVTKGDIIATTAVDDGSVIRRALVGGLIGGSTGAIIGGLTAPSETVYMQQDDVKHHSYTIFLTVNDRAHPIVCIDVDNDALLLHEIVALFTDIIYRKYLK